MKKIIFYLLVLFSTTIFAAEPQYVIIIDASDSGSVLHLFQYEKSKIFPIINDIFTKKNTHNLASYESNPQLASAAIKDLLDAVKAKLISLHVSPRDIPLNLMGTANMRLLPEEKQNEIYVHVREYIADNYDFTIKNIATLSGKMEGVYDWLDVNYLAENFQKDRSPVGIISGGSIATEIAFATGDKSKPEDEIDLNINGKKYTVFSRSFLRLGLDQARQSMNQDLSSYACYPIDYPMSSGMKGNFDLPTCNFVYAKFLEQYAIPEKILPLQQQKFAVISGAARTWELFGVEIPDKDAVEARIYYVCTTTWDAMQKEYAEMPAKLLSAYCADGVYLVQFIFSTYHLQANQLWVTDRIRKQIIDWPLGMALYILALNPETQLDFRI